MAGDMSDTEPPKVKFDSTRYSPVNVAIWQRLPNSNGRAFGIASALGSYLNAAGSSKDLHSGREAVGSMVTPTRLPAILQAIGIGERQWRRYVEDWVKRGIAHQCRIGYVFLFTQPEFMECAACRKRLEFVKAPARGRRGRKRDDRGRFTAKSAAASRPNVGPIAAIEMD